MKVDYLIQLFKSSNKKIWNNKVFSYFLIALVIGFTVILRKLPQIYYKYLLNPVLLLLVVILIILIASHNYSLGIILGVCLIALYYPTQQQYQNIYLETFENETETIPIEKTDKNIVDDEEPIKEPVKEPIEKPTEEPKKENKKTDKKTDKSEESDGELASDEEPQSEDEKSSKDKKEKEEKEEKISGMRLENLNPSYYKKKSSNSSNNKKIVENFNKNTKAESNNKSKSKPKNNEETFLGDVRKIVNDLDTGNNKMNANNAIKKISELMYNKHKTSIQQILNNADDDSDTEDDDKI